MSRVELVIGPELAGARLDVAVASLAEVGSRAAAQRVIDAGHVTVAGVVRVKRHQVRAGDRVEVDLSAAERPADAAGAEGVDYAILHEDGELIVVDKPAGVVVHPGRGHPSGTLVQALSGRAAGGAAPWRPGVVHRLDRDTSGLLVVAKSDATHRALQALIRQRRMRREYLALVVGRPDALSGTIDAPIGRDRSQRTLISTRTDRPRQARTHFRRLEELPGATLVEVRLETGRTHQIRAHFAAIGHPLVGDPAYGGAGAAAGLDRQFLHAGRLAFRHPATGAELDLRSPLPAELEDILEAVRAGGAAG